MAASDIVIKGAREHNLRDVELVLPRNKLICLTGVSGSGKSSLAFDTLGMMWSGHYLGDQTGRPAGGLCKTSGSNWGARTHYTTSTKQMKP